MKHMKQERSASRNRKAATTPADRSVDGSSTQDQQSAATEVGIPSTGTPGPSGEQQVATASDAAGFADMQEPSQSGILGQHGPNGAEEDAVTPITTEGGQSAPILLETSHPCSEQIPGPDEQIPSSEALITTDETVDQQFATTSIAYEVQSIQASEQRSSETQEETPPVTHSPIQVYPGQNIDDVIGAILQRDYIGRRVSLDLIDFYPRNRKQFKPGTLEELAANIRKVDVINAIILRPMAEGRFEVVAGERRVRASRIAGLADIPSRIYELSDAEARQIRVSENAHREDLHPMEEATAIGEMLEDYPTVELIAGRLGKTVAFIQNRVKLLSLVPEAQEILLADVIGVRDAQELAAFEDADQHAFLDRYLDGWKEKEIKSFPDFKSAINNLKCSLKNPPFDPEDTTLNPSMGACSGCQFNSGCEQFLFAELATDPVCRKAACYEDKTSKQLVKDMTEAVGKHKPMAIATVNVLTEDQKALIKEIPGTEGLPFYLEKMVHEVRKPKMPQKDKFKDTKGKFNKRAFDEKMADYKEALGYQESALKNRKIYKAILLQRDGKIVPYMFTLDSKANETGQSGKVGLIQEDIKSGTVTLSQLLDEMSRIKNNEMTAAKKDAGELLEKIHEALHEKTDADPSQTVYTPMDKEISRWLMYNTLGYSDKRDVEGRILPKDWEKLTPEAMLSAFEILTDDQEAYLNRKLLLTIGETKRPGTTAAFLLSRLAQNAGIDTDKIQQEQDKKAEERKKKFKKSESDLQKIINRKKKKRSGKVEPEGVEQK